MNSNDRYLSFANSNMGRSIVKSLGLPMPMQLDRYVPGQDFIGGPVLLGAAAGGELLAPLANILSQSQSKTLVNKQDNNFVGITEALSGADISWHPWDQESEQSQTFKALIFDATGIKNSEELHALHGFFHPVMRKLQGCSRIIVLGRTPELCTDPKQRTAQRALEGLIRSTAKEVKKGSTSQLIYVAPGAENNIESSVRFFLSGKSAYVSAQIVRVSSADNVVTPDNWEKPLAGKTALVTGASRGIGEAIANTLARDGAHVICLDIPPAQVDLDKVAGKLGGSTLAIDITDAAAPKTIADYLESEHKGVDIVVHNAGVTRDKTLGGMKGQLWDMVIDINLSSEERINDELLARNVINQGGRVICVSSISGIAGNMGQSNYATSKAGVIGMVQANAEPLAAQGITINAVAPGFIETQMTAAIPFAIREAGRRLNSMAQGGLPLDVAEAIAWYASPASQGVNGNIVRVCGQSLLGA